MKPLQLSKGIVYLVILFLLFLGLVFFLMASSQMGYSEASNQSNQTSTEKPTKFPIDENSPPSIQIITQVSNNQMAQKLFDQGLHHRWTTKDLQKSVEILQDVVNKYPETNQAIEALIHLGGIYRWDMPSPQYEDAAMAYRKIIDTYTTYNKIPEIYLNLGGLYQYDMKPSKDARALTTYKELIAKYPESSEAIKGRGLLAAIYSRLAKIEKQPEYYQQTVKYFQEEIDMLPKEDKSIPEIKAQLANTYLFDMRLPLSALPIYEDIMNRWVKTKYYYEALLWSTYIRFRENKEIKAEDAVEVCRQIIGEPNIIQLEDTQNNKEDSYWLNVKASARYTIGFIRYWQGDKDLAIKEFQKVLDDYGKFAYEDMKAECYLFIGHILEQQEQYRPALQYYETAMKVVPNSKYCLAKGEIPARIERVKTQLEFGHF